MRTRHFVLGALSLLASIGAAGPATVSWAAAEPFPLSDTADASSARTVHVKLTPPPGQLAQCMPNADVSVDVKLTTEKKGFDVFGITAKHVVPNRDYTVFLTGQADFPFGASEYIGEFSSDAQGNGHSEYHLIVQEAFASTLVNGERVRADMNQVVVWFADPKDDDVCLGQDQGPVTPFDGDGVAGAVAFSSAGSTPLPAP